MNTEETIKALSRAQALKKRISGLEQEYAQIIASISLNGNGAAPKKRRGHPMSEASKRKLRRIAAQRWKQARAEGRAKL